MEQRGDSWHFVLALSSSEAIPVSHVFPRFGDFGWQAFGVSCVGLHHLLTRARELETLRTHRAFRGVQLGLEYRSFLWQRSRKDVPQETAGGVSEDFSSPFEATFRLVRAPGIGLEPSRPEAITALTPL